MASKKLQQTTQELLNYADIKINGTRPWDIQIQNEEFYSRVLSAGSLGLGESYMDEWWKCEALDQFFHKILKANLQKKIGISRHIIWNFIKSVARNQQRTSKAHEVGEHHYDIGNDLYEKMLDKRMNYSCGYWKDATTLDEAQEHKLDLICKKLQLKPGISVLDIGCGWGSFAKYAAEKYQANVVGLTISKEQAQLAQKLCEGLSVDIQLQDYRNIKTQYDRVVSIGMFEHVGYKNYRTFMKIVKRCLKDEGIFLLHTIGRKKSVRSLDPWFDKYIFPNGMLPSVRQIAKASEGHFQLQDWHNFGYDYDKTLMAWHENFNNHWDSLKNNYDDRFFRMWNYYLLSCAGSFRAHVNQLWQIVFTKFDSQVDYRSIR